MITGSCLYCGREKKLCADCDKCHAHCVCGASVFDADELGLDPETDNTPKTESRHA